jgi:hypothetical protein
MVKRQLYISLFVLVVLGIMGLYHSVRGDNLGKGTFRMYPSLRVPTYSPRNQYYPDPYQNTRREHYSPRHQSDTPRSHYEREPDYYPPQYVAMAKKDKHKLSKSAQNWISGGEVSDSFVHGVKELILMDLEQLHVHEDTHLSIVETHRRLRDSTPNTTGAFKFTRWPTLDVLQPVPFVEFYSLLSSALIMFHIALTPFNGIQLANEAYGLFIPGLGYTAYKQHSQALWSIIHTLLPTTRSDIKTHIMCTRSTQDGYQLLWLVGSQVVKVWSNLQSVPEPRFQDDDNVFSFCESMELYKILRRMRGQGLNDKEIGIKYLIGIRGKHEALAQSMAQQLTKVELVDGILPSDWSLSAMSNLLNTTVTGSVLNEMRLSPARQRRPYFRANVVSEEGSDYVYVDDDDASDFYSSTTPSINTTTNTRFSDPQQQRGQSRGQHRGQLKTHQHRDRGSEHNRRTPRFDGNCAACGRYGHKMSHCDHLAIYYNIQRAMKGMEPDVIKMVEENWMKKNKKYVGDGALTPSQVVANLVSSQMDMDKVFADIDWESWTDSSGFTLQEEYANTSE